MQNAVDYELLVPIPYSSSDNNEDSFTVDTSIRLVYISDAADELPSVDLGGRRFITKNTITTHMHLQLHIYPYPLPLNNIATTPTPTYS